MNMLILNTQKQSELAALNASGDPTHQLFAIPLTNGDAALSASLLGDCGEGQTWEHYAILLQSLSSSEVSADSFQENQLA